MTSLTAIGANMAADSNMNFHMGMLPTSLHSSHVVSFQSGAMSSGASSMMFPMDSAGGVSCSPGMTLVGSPGGMGNTCLMTQSGSSSGTLFLDQMAGVKADTGLAADWSYDEQSVLEAGLLKYADEPNMMKYVKIAASLHDKTVRDVALRCRWMTKKENGKRRKPEEYYNGKKVKDRKDKVVDSSLLGNSSSCQPANMAAYSFTLPHMDHSNRFSCEVPVIDGATQCRIEENLMVFRQIEDNFETLKLQDNISLLCHSRDNITSILNSMREMPGIMSQMPPLPIEINGELADAILPCTNQRWMLDRPRGNS